LPQTQTEPLIRIQKALKVFLEKSRRDELNRMNHKRLITQNKDKVAKVFNAWLDYIRDNRAKTLKGRTPDAITRNMIDWDDVRKKGKELFQPVLHSILTEAGKAVVERKVLKQDRFDPLGEGAVEWVKEHSAELVVGITKETMKGIRSYIRWGINEGKSIYHIGRELRPVVGLTDRLALAVGRRLTELETLPKYSHYTAEQRFRHAERYAKKLQKYRTERIARTETAKALGEGELQGYKQMGVEKVRFNADPECCDLCAEKDGQVYTIDEAQGVIPVHPNCLPGDSLVSPCGRISGVTKRWYEGKMIVIKTASGNVLRCTPNHPIFTSIGLLPSSSLNIGSYVISYRGSKRPFFRIFSSFLKSPGVTACKVPSSSKYFHGDGIGSKVAIVASNRFLMDGANTSFFKHHFKLNLFIRKIRRIFFDSLSMLTFCLPRNLSASCGLMGVSNLPFSLLGGHLFPLKNPSLTMRSDMNSRIHESFSNYVSGDSISFRKSQFRNTRFIKRNDFFSGKLDQVTHLNTTFYKGFVYNLETSKSYYIANNIASHNCECTFTAVV